MTPPRVARHLWSLVALAGLLGCAATAPPAKPTEPPREVPSAPPTVAEDAPRAPPRLGLAACDTIRLDVSLVEVRAARRADWIAAIMRAEPRIDGFSLPGKLAPLDAANEARLCARELGAWEAVVLRHALPEPTVREALALYGSRVGGGGPLAIGVGGVRASKVRVAEDVWTAIERDPRELWLVAPEAARASLAEHAARATELPLERGTAVRVHVTAPVERLPWAASELRGATALTLAVESLPNGGAHLTGVVSTASRDDAKAVARALTGAAERLSETLFVRIVLRGILSRFTAIARGDAVVLQLPVEAPALDSLLSLVAARLGAKLPPTSPRPEERRGGAGLSPGGPNVVKDAP